MISGKNIICFASGWDYHPTSKHHIMRRLARHNNVIWVNWHASRRPRVRPGDLRMIWDKIRQIGRGPRRVSDRITVVTPFQVPMPAWQTARRFNTFIVGRVIERVLETLPARPVQLWSFAPDVGDFVGRFNEELAVYYCVDAFGEFPGYDREMIERRERELLARSDVVITTSGPLYESKKRLHPNVHLVEHGVDYDRLSQAVTEELPIPLELASLPRPIFGYVGVVGEWVDLEQVAALARGWPQASVVVIGPNLVPPGPCANLPNVYWLGERDHRSLPGYLRLFDVGLIPFKRVALTRNANPIKLYEYLAAGVPVISTAMPAVRPIPHSVWIADDPVRTMRCCQEALEHNGPAERRQRSQMMRAESWESRIKRIEAIIGPGRRGDSRGSSSPAEPATVGRQFIEDDCRELAVMTST